MLFLQVREIACPGSVGDIALDLSAAMPASLSNSLGLDTASSIDAINSDIDPTLSALLALWYLVITTGNTPSDRNNLHCHATIRKLVAAALTRQHELRQNMSMSNRAVRCGRRHHKVIVRNLRELADWTDLQALPLLHADLLALASVHAIADVCMKRNKVETSLMDRVAEVDDGMLEATMVELVQAHLEMGNVVFATWCWNEGAVAGKALSSYNPQDIERHDEDEDNSEIITSRNLSVDKCRALSELCVATGKIQPPVSTIWIFINGMHIVKPPQYRTFVRYIL